MNISLVRVVNEFYPRMGGSINHVIELSKAIDPYLKKQIIIAPIYEKENYFEFDNSFPIEIIRVPPSFIDLPWLKKIPGDSLINRLFFYAMNVSKKIMALEEKGYHIDIVHVHLNTLGLFLLMWFRIFRISNPLIIMQHGSSISIESENFLSKFAQNLALIMFNWYKPAFYLQLDDGTINNNFLNELTKRRIPHRTVNHALDIHFFQPLPYKKTGADFTILSNHRLESFKRVDLAIIAFHQFIENVNYPKNVKFNIIGAGSLQKELEILVSQLHLNRYVEFLGEKNFEDYRNELVSADLVLGSSLYSNVNRSIQEAMACEKSVIVFDSISSNSLFINMENCILVPAGDINKYAQGIELLYKDSKLRELIGINARKSIVNSRSWNKRIDQELLIYSSLLSNYHQ